jgi:hypothetical protein
VLSGIRKHQPNTQKMARATTMTASHHNNKVENKEDKTRPKCASGMLSDKMFGSGAVEMSLFNEDEFKGDDMKVFHCRKCGFMELYRIAKKRFATVTTKKERTPRTIHTRKNNHACLTSLFHPSVYNARACVGKG